MAQHRKSLVPTNRNNSHSPWLPELLRSALTALATSSSQVNSFGAVGGGIFNPIEDLEGLLSFYLKHSNIQLQLVCLQWLTWRRNGPGDSPLLPLGNMSELVRTTLTPMESNFNSNFQLSATHHHHPETFLPSFLTSRANSWQPAWTVATSVVDSTDSAVSGVAT